MPSTTQLTSRERVQRCFTHQPHDRIPRHDTFWRETIERWQREGLDGDAGTVLRDYLQSDFSGIGGGWPVPFPGHSRVISEDEQTQTVENAWGEIVRSWKSRSGTPEHLDWGCQTREQWEHRFLPAYKSRVPQADPEQVRQRYQAAREAEKWVFLTALESFESTRHLMGDEGCMVAMAEDPEFVAEVSRVYTDAVIQELDAHMAAGVEPDGVWCYGDMAYNHATMCSPKMYKELIWPDHKRLADWAHKRGMIFIYHTDGDVNGVMDLYLEAGFDALQPLEAKANMDVRKLCPTYGDRMAFFGNIDVMVMATNNREKLEHEIATKLEAGKATHAYAYHSDHSVPPQASWQTYQFIIEMIEKHGRYD